MVADSFFDVSRRPRPFLQVHTGGPASVLTTGGVPTLHLPPVPARHPSMHSSRFTPKVGFGARRPAAAKTAGPAGCLPTGTAGAASCRLRGAATSAPGANSDRSRKEASAAWRAFPCPLLRSASDAAASTSYSRTTTATAAASNSSSAGSGPAPLSGGGRQQQQPLQQQQQPFLGYLVRAIAVFQQQQQRQQLLQHPPLRAGPLASSSQGGEAGSFSNPRSTGVDEAAGTGPESSSGSSGFASYSDHYKSQNSRFQPAAPPPQQQLPVPAVNGGATEAPMCMPGPSGSGGSGVGGSSSSNGSSSASAASSVEAALQAARQALDTFESSLEEQRRQQREGVEGEDDGGRGGGSGMMEERLVLLLSVARNVAALGACCLLLVASHAFGLAWQWVSAVCAAAAIAVYGYRRGSLDQTGAAAAFAVGTATLGCSLRFGATLVLFFLASSKLTGYKEEVKAKLDDGHKPGGGQRNWLQVLANGGLPTLLAVSYGVLCGCVDVPLGASIQSTCIELGRSKLLTLLSGAFLGYYAACCGDTWASELGSLSSATPLLLTTGRPVRPGTNGGVTSIGLAASVAGGLFVGAVFYGAAIVSPTLWIFERQQTLAAAQWPLVLLGGLAGLAGSLLDSLLGATLQFSGYNRRTGRVTGRRGPGVQHISGLPFLDNNAVNLLSASATSAATGLLAVKLFGF